MTKKSKWTLLTMLTALFTTGWGLAMLAIPYYVPFYRSNDIYCGITENVGWDYRDGYYSGCSSASNQANNLLNNYFNVFLGLWIPILVVGSLSFCVSLGCCIRSRVKSNHQAQIQETNNNIELATRSEPVTHEIAIDTEDLDREIANLEKKKRVAELKKEIRYLEASQVVASTSTF